MNLANPYFLENVYQDQPYSSMLLIAPKCDFTCEGCQNKHLKDDYKNFTIDYLIKEYNKNPFFEGITVGGLEMFLSGDDFLYDLKQFIKKAKIKNITFYTRFTLKDNKVSNFIKDVKKLEFVNNLYLKTGVYNNKLPEKTEIIDNWSIIIGSNNQNFKKIK